MKIIIPENKINFEHINIIPLLFMTVREILDSIKEIRKLKNLSQKDIAEKLRISKSQYGHYETGKSQMSLNTFIELFRILEIDVVDFFKRTMDEITEEDVRKLEEIVELFKSKLKLTKPKESDNDISDN